MIRIDNLTLKYGDRSLVEGASARFERGTLTALVGRNGAGKSTLLRALAGLADAVQGSIFFSEKKVEDISTADVARRVSFVTTERIRIANLRCRDVVALGRAPYTNWIGRMQSEDMDIVMGALSRVGMLDYAERTMDKMSDGECQRIMIARALAQQTPIILLDEPTSFLDIPNRRELCALLADLAHKEGKCIIFSTHELDIALSLSDSIALLDSPHLHHRSVADPQLRVDIDRLFTRA